MLFKKIFTNFYKSSQNWKKVQVIYVHIFFLNMNEEKEKKEKNIV